MPAKSKKSKKKTTKKSVKKTAKKAPKKTVKKTAKKTTKKAAKKPVKKAKKPVKKTAKKAAKKPAKKAAPKPAAAPAPRPATPPTTSSMPMGVPPAAIGAPKRTKAEHTVAVGDSLRLIALKYYGPGGQENWKVIYDANKAVIGENPYILKPGQVLKIPEL
jgi:nucleoid-associated protein YgaU